MLYETMKTLVYTEHPMRHPTIGYLPVVQAVTRNDVISFYRDRYVPQNMVFAVVGDIQTQHVLDRVASLFASFSRTTERTVTLPSEPPQASPRSARLEMEGETVHFSLGWPTIALQHPNLYSLDLISDLLTNGDSSRLGSRLRVEQPHAIGVQSFSFTPSFVPGWFGVSVECRPDRVDICRRTILEEIERLQDEPVDESELNKVKRQQAAAHVFSQQTVQAQANALLSSFIATGDPRFDEQYVRAIQQVTPDQVRDMARQYFQARSLSEVIIDPPGLAQPLPETSVTALESPVLRHEFPNGLVLLVKRHAVTPIVTVQAFVRAGSISDTDAASGLAALATQLMMKGTEKHTARQIATFFDSVGGVLLTDSQRNTSYLQCSILKEDLPPSLDYAFQVLFRPSFPAEEFLKVKSQLLDAIAARKGDPQTEISDFWTSLLPANSPYHRRVEGTLETVGSLQVSDCADFHRRMFVPENMVLAIFGDIDPQATLEQLKCTFGSVPRSRAFERQTFPSRHSEIQGRYENLTSERENTAMVVIGYPTFPLTSTDEQSALEVLDAVLTGGRGIGGRLFKELRGERLVYYVAGRSITGPAPGFYCLVAQTQPQSREEVVRRIQASVRRICDEGIPQAEFELAKQKLTVAHIMQNTTPASQAFQAAVYELLGLGFDFDQQYEQRIRQVTVEAVQELTRRYFHDPIIATSSPSPSSGA
jgi:zinc protease